MQRIKKLHRSDYAGEEITTNLRWAGGEWHSTKEFIPNRIQNLQQSNRAVIIGNGNSRKTFDISLLKLHRGYGQGLGAVQTYGCNAVYRDYESTFSVVTGREMADEIANSGYCDDHIVYSHSQNIQKYPGKFYLPPQDPGLNAGALATYIAAFDGHKTIYMLGFDGAHGDDHNNNVYAGTQSYADIDQHYSDEQWVINQRHIMELYDDVDFVRVKATSGQVCPERWLELLNFRQLTYQQFVLEIDL